MLKIYGNKISSPCHKVAFVAELIGREYEWVELEFGTDDLKSAEYRAIHPAGKVPAIQNGELTLFESEAIIRYLAEKAESPLFPADVETRALVNQWGYFSVIHVGNAMGKVFFNRVIAPRFDLEVDERSLTEGSDWLARRFLPICDRRLGESEHLATADLSLADITLLSVLDPAEKADVDLSPFSNLTKWRGRLQGMEFWKKVHGAT